MTREKKHLYSLEKLSHFRCGSCNKWWTIADAPPRKKRWHCPWCGLEARIERRTTLVT